MRALYVLPALALLTLSPLAAHDRISTKVTWDREIAPIVQARCVSCHRDGGRAPMPLTTYEEARPWAKAIKEEVLTRRMPKWPVVRGYGDFLNDRSLSPFEVALIASWADGGAPASAKASTFAKATADETAGKPQSSGDTKPRGIVSPIHEFTVPDTRAVTVPCGARRMPPGRLVAVKPLLEKGDSIRLTLTHPDGGEEPLIWLKDFDPAFVETYWLRTTPRITPAMRLMMTADGPCSVDLLYER